LQELCVTLGVWACREDDSHNGGSFDRTTESLTMQPAGMSLRFKHCLNVLSVYCEIEGEACENITLSFTDGRHRRVSVWWWRGWREKWEMRDWAWGAYTSLLPQPLWHCWSSMYTISCNRFRVFQQPTWECRAARGEQPRDGSSLATTATEDGLLHTPMNISDATLQMTWKMLKEIGFYYASNAKKLKKLGFTTPAIDLVFKRYLHTLKPIKVLDTRSFLP
jgi:hypothetical protein